MTEFNELVPVNQNVWLQPRVNTLKHLGKIAAAEFLKKGVNKDFVMAQMLETQKTTGRLFKKTTTTESHRDFIDSYWLLDATRDNPIFSDYYYYLLTHDGDIGYVQSATLAVPRPQYQEIVFNKYNLFTGINPIENRLITADFIDRAMLSINGIRAHNKIN